MKHFLKYINKISKVAFWGLLVWLLIRLFFVQLFYVPTASMENTFHKGDYILVNKLAYGARMPFTPISLPFNNSKIYVDWLQLPYWRIPGYTEVKRNDVVVFNLPSEIDYPIDIRTHYMKRCIGLPGDTVCLQAGRVWVNGIQQKEVFVVDSTYTVEKSSYSPNYFPHNALLKWNIDYFGPLYIPKKGSGVALTRENICLYQNIIEKAENNELKVKNDSVFINGVYSTNYSFKMDYYFMLGDNRHNSIDSRFWGLVPEDHLLGKVAFGGF